MKPQLFQRCQCLIQRSLSLPFCWTSSSDVMCLFHFCMDTLRQWEAFLVLEQIQESCVWSPVFETSKPHPQVCFSVLKILFLKNRRFSKAEALNSITFILFPFPSPCFVRRHQYFLQGYCATRHHPLIWLKHSTILANSISSYMRICCLRVTC